MSFSVQIPKAVQDADDAADAALLEADGPQDTPEGTPKEQTPNEEPAPAAEETPAPAEEPAPAETPAPTEDYLQKYRTIAGKYNAEVPRLQAQVNELRRSLEETERRREQAPPAAPPAPKVEGKKRFLKKEELDEYGESLLDLQSRMARGVAEEVVESQISELRRELAGMKSQLSRTSGETFWDKVEKSVPGARAVNESDPDWHAFLGTSDPVTGARYRDLGLSAIQSGDSSRLVAIFRIFAATNGRVEEEPAPAPAPEPQRKTPPVKANGTRTVSQAPKPVNPKGTFRESEVTKFYADITRGVWNGREKEQEAREAEIELAANEGRILPG